MYTEPDTALEKDHRLPFDALRSSQDTEVGTGGYPRTSWTFKLALASLRFLGLLLIQHLLRLLVLLALLLLLTLVLVFLAASVSHCVRPFSQDDVPQWPTSPATSRQRIMPTPPCHRETVLPQLLPRTAMDDLGSCLSSCRRVAQPLPWDARVVPLNEVRNLHAGSRRSECAYRAARGREEELG